MSKDVAARFVVNFVAEACCLPIKSKDYQSSHISFSPKVMGRMKNLDPGSGPQIIRIMGPIFKELEHIRSGRMISRAFEFPTGNGSEGTNFYVYSTNNHTIVASIVSVTKTWERDRWALVQSTWPRAGTEQQLGGAWDD